MPDYNVDNSKKTSPITGSGCRVIIRVEDGEVVTEEKAIPVPHNRLWLADDLKLLLRTLAIKSRDYASPDDDMENFRGGGMKGIYNRLGDKMQRAKNFIKRGVLECEGFEDACLDIAGYALLLRRAYSEGVNVEGETWEN